MSMIMCPFDEFKNAKRLVVLWLNSDCALAKHVPQSWCQIWNACLHRYCTDGAANLLHELCIANKTLHPNIITGDMDSIEQKSIEYFEQHANTKIHKTPDQNYTDLCKALNLISETIEINNGEAKAILILGGLNGRFDHTLSTLNSAHNFIAKKRLPVYVIDSTNLVTILPTGTAEIHLEQKYLTEKCGLLPLCQRETRVTSHGFKWNLDDQLMEYGGVISSCNELVEDHLVVKTNTPIVLTLQLKSAENFIE